MKIEDRLCKALELVELTTDDVENLLS